METYRTAMALMRELFGRDYTFALATTEGKVPSVRFVDTFYDGAAFYVVTHERSQKVKELTKNPNVALCNKLYRFSGTARNIGHPHKAENGAIRGKLMQVFEPWYLAHNNEDDPGMCYVRIMPEYGFIYQDGTGYKIDFEKKTAERFPFDFDLAPMV